MRGKLSNNMHGDIFMRKIAIIHRPQWRVKYDDI